MRNSSLRQVRTKTKASTSGDPRVQGASPFIRCPFCPRRFNRACTFVCERVTEHIERLHPDEALTFTETDRRVLAAIDEGLDVIPWPEDSL
jgi:hypothetical protein